MRLAVPACFAIAAIGCAHAPTPIGDGTYYAYKTKTNLTPEEPTAIWFDKHVLNVRNGDLKLRTSPGYVLHGRAISSASDGGFRTYDGSIELAAGRTIVGLRQLTCDYCEPLDGPVPAKQAREYVAILHDDGSFEVDRVRYYADPLARPLWYPPPDDSGDRFAHLAQFKLSETSLDAIEEILDPAQEFDLDDGGPGLAVCYRLSYPTMMWTFESSPWFGGKERTLLKYSIDSTVDAARPCTNLELDASSLEVDGVRLGMTETEFRDLVGEPLEVTRTGSLRRQFHSERLMTERDLKKYRRKDRRTVDGHVDRYLTIEGAFERGLLSRFSVERAETF